MKPSDVTCPDPLFSSSLFPSSLFPSSLFPSSPPSSPPLLPLPLLSSFFPSSLFPSFLFPFSLFPSSLFPSSPPSSPPPLPLQASKSYMDPGMGRIIYERTGVSALSYIFLSVCLQLTTWSTTTLQEYFFVPYAFTDVNDECEIHKGDEVSFYMAKNKR